MTIKHITVIGAGVIGMSWVTFYLSKGFSVVANDPNPAVEKELKTFIKENWSTLPHASVTLEEALEKLAFTLDLKESLKHADFVHENGPERLEFKQSLFAKLDDLLPPQVIVASSTSGIPMSDMQEPLTKHPERFVVAHPFNPPHIMPLVEIVGGKKTDVKNLDVTQAFFDKLGKKTIRLKKELPGHIANRIAQALYKEVLWLISEDAISVADIDKAITWGPGLRWGVMGPNLLYHLGGGQGGIQHFLEQFAQPLNMSFKRLQTPELNKELCEKVIKGVHAEAGKLSISELESKRNTVLLALIDLKEKTGL